MAFAITVQCGDEWHPVVVDLSQPKIFVPRHPAELVQRYSALYELGGEPLPCCGLAIALQEYLRPGYLALPCCNPESDEVYAVWRGWVERTLGYCMDTIVITTGKTEPTLTGHFGFNIGARGQLILNLQGYLAKGGQVTTHPSTRRLLVGEDYLLRRGQLVEPNFFDLPPDEPVPEWETCYLGDTNGNHCDLLVQQSDTSNLNQHSEESSHLTRPLPQRESLAQHG